MFAQKQRRLNDISTNFIHQDVKSEDSTEAEKLSRLPIRGGNQIKDNVPNSDNIKNKETSRSVIELMLLFSITTKLPHMTNMWISKKWFESHQ